MGIIIQPCASKVAQKNFNNTITNVSLTLDSIKMYLDKSDFDTLKEIYSGNQIQVWGIKENNKLKWNDIKTGEIVLFSKNKFIFASAVVCYKLKNENIARTLWGSDFDEKTWEYLYFVIDLEFIKVPYEKFNDIVGYKKDYNYMSFLHLSDERSNKFLDAYPLASSTFMPNVDIDEYYEVIKEPFANEDSLDKKTNGTSRKEQGFLRKHLFRNKLFAQCAICGKEFPIGFLWASHIKPRYECSMDEKKDYKNIVAPMCKFGCDDLYEKGYLSVTQGKIIVLKKTDSEVIDEYLSKLNGKSCSYYNKENAGYFESHYISHNNTTQI